VKAGGDIGNVTMTVAAGDTLTTVIDGTTVGNISITGAGDGNVKVLATTAGNVTVSLSATGGIEASTIDLTSVTAAGTVTVTGGLGDDKITGAVTASTLNGGEGKDTITGGAGADTINGGAGADTITGGAGADTITGGTGADTFIFADTAAKNGSDTITDFTVGTGGDKLDLNAALAASAALITPPTAAELADQATPIVVDNAVLLINSGTLATTGYDTAAELAALLADTGAFDAVDVDVSNTSFLLIAANDGTTALLWRVTSDSTAGITAAELTLEATITIAADGIDAFVAGNFVLG
jgi:Ca2+-binding RTX toxin-like protein